MPHQTEKRPRNTSPTADDYFEGLTEDVGRALNVWLSLSPAERDEIKKATEIFDSLPDTGRHQLRDIVINVVTGPLETKCKYCGRG